VVFGGMQLQMLIALAMVGYLAAVTQSPITAFVIVMEMIDGHALVISLMATALIASRVSRLFAPPLYETLALRYLVPQAPPAPAAAGAPQALEPLFEDEPEREASQADAPPQSQ
jgi:H+/Cl- antiporter ClcA